MLLRERSERQHVTGRVDEHRSGITELLVELLHDPSVLRPRRRPSGCSKIDRTKVLTIGHAAFGTSVARFRMKWVRHRCQLAPTNTAASHL